MACEMKNEIRMQQRFFFTGENVSTFRAPPHSQTKVLPCRLPVNTGSDRTKSKDFFKVKSAGRVSRIAVARHSPEPFFVLQLGFQLYKGLDDF
jgi:hypothetical protein